MQLEAISMQVEARLGTLRGMQLAHTVEEARVDEVGAANGKDPHLWGSGWGRRGEHLHAHSATGWTGCSHLERDELHVLQLRGCECRSDVLEIGRAVEDL